MSSLVVNHVSKTWLGAKGLSVEAIRGEAAGSGKA